MRTKKTPLKKTVTKGANFPIECGDMIQPFMASFS